MIKKNKTHNKIKNLVFNLFAKMREKNIKWVVIGGLNNYPNEIGRDMDIVIENKNQVS